MSDETFKPLFESTFDIDEDAIEADRAVQEVVDDDILRILRRENRVAVALADARQPPCAREAGRAAYEIPLLFVVHAHPECSFAWTRLVIDLSPTPDCVVADMAPRAVEDVPVTVKTTVGVDLGFSLAVSAVDLSAKPEMARERTVYVPTLVTSGVGFRKAYWDFQPKGGDYLHADRELRLLVDAPADTPVDAVLTIRARVRMRGVPRLVPLLARSGTMETFLRLAHS